MGKSTPPLRFKSRRGEDTAPYLATGVDNEGRALNLRDGRLEGTPVPEPGTWSLLALAAAAFACAARRRG
jgi:hypothetical protein